MSESNTKANNKSAQNDTSGGAAAKNAGSNSAGSSTELARNPMGTRGHTSIADVVVSKIAGIAAREVGGVHGVGGASRMVGALRERIPGARMNVTEGISVEVGEQQAALDVSLIAEYGVAIHELAAAVRQNIIAAVEGMTGLEVTEVNVEVTDVHLAGSDMPDSDDEAEQQRSRVR